MSRAISMPARCVKNGCLYYVPQDKFVCQRGLCDKCFWLETPCPSEPCRILQHKCHGGTGFSKVCDAHQRIPISSARGLCAQHLAEVEKNERVYPSVFRMRCCSSTGCNKRAETIPGCNRFKCCPEHKRIFWDGLLNNRTKAVRWNPKRMQLLEALKSAGLEGVKVGFEETVQKLPATTQYGSIAGEHTGFSKGDLYRAASDIFACFRIAPGHQRHVDLRRLAVQKPVPATLHACDWQASETVSGSIAWESILSHARLSIGRGA